mmetsp:Transcript_12083/g.36412  ORF Transcript_12083/g.36412 Transcript_12083/m.36412 type:complete len:221 (-) Transcript_12083:892-1554(-)
MTDGGTTSWKPASRAVSCARWFGGKMACRSRASRNSSRLPLWTARSSPRSHSSKVRAALVTGSNCDTENVNAKERRSSSGIVFSLLSDSHRLSSISCRSSNTRGSPTRSFSNLTFGDASRQPPWASNSILPRPLPTNRYSSSLSFASGCCGGATTAESRRGELPCSSSSPLPEGRRPVPSFASSSTTPWRGCSSDKEDWVLVTAERLPPVPSPMGPSATS